MDTETLKKEIQKIYGDKYDVSKVEYNDSHTPVCVICKKHGEFEQLPYDLLRGHTGCKECLTEIKREAQSKRFNIDIIKERAKALYGDDYSFDKAEYVNIETPIIVTCKKHGDFKKSPYELINKHRGCPQCIKENYIHPRKRTRERVVSKFKEKYGDKYDYNKITEETDLYGELDIICPIHGVFKRTVVQHNNGLECPKCFPKKVYHAPFTTETFIEEAEKVHGKGTYDYIHSKYEGYDVPLDIYCHKLDEFGEEHGLFKQNPHSHLAGSGCPKCAKKFGSLDRFIKLANRRHSNYYKYNHVDFHGMLKEVDITCPVHGDFKLTPNAHLLGRGCPLCSKSTMEKEVRQLLIDNDIKFEMEKTFDWLVYEGKMKLDFYLPQYNIAIECQGEQHFFPVKLFGGDDGLVLIKKRDELKKKQCEEHDIPIIYYSNSIKLKEIKEIINTHEQLLNEIKKYDKNITEIQT